MITAKRIEQMLHILRRAKDFPLDMREGRVCAFGDDHPCGTPACVAGNYWLAKHWDGKTEYPKESIGFVDGIVEMAKDLGVTPLELEDWASRNYKIWGNRAGGKMFKSSYAYLSESSDTLFVTMKDVIAHWEGVLERFKKECPNV